MAQVLEVAPMEFDTAARAAAQIVNVLKKFAQAEEVLIAAVNAEASLSILAPQVAAAQAELADLTNQKQGLMGEIIDAKAELANDLDAAKQIHLDEIAAQNLAATAELDSLKAQIKTATATYNKAQATRKATLSDLDTQATAAEERLHQAQADLAALKANL
jgi:hypothetical protein